MEPNQNIILSRKKAFTTIFKASLPIIGTFTGSFGIVLTGILAGNSPGNKEDNLAATNLFTTMTNTLTGISVSTLFAIILMTSELYGAYLANSNNDRRIEISKMLNSGLSVAAAIVPFPVLFSYYSETIFINWFKQNAQLARLAQTYLRPFSLAFPPLLFRLVFEQLLFSFGKQKITMGLGLLSFGIGSAIAALLCFGAGAIPALGLSGIAYGFVTDAYLSCLAFGLYLALHSGFKEFKFFKDFRFDRKNLQQILKILKTGSFLAAENSAILGANFLINLFAGWLGKDELAAFNYASLLNLFAFVIQMPFALGTSAVVGNYIGKKEFFNASRLARYAPLASLTAITTVLLTPTLHPPIMNAIVTSGAPVKGNVLEMAKSLTQITIVGSAGNAVSLAALFASRAAGDIAIPTLLSIGSIWLGVIFSYILGFHTKLGIYGIAIGFAMGYMISMCAQLGRMFKGVASPEALARMVEKSSKNAPQTKNQEQETLLNVTNTHPKSKSCLTRFFACFKDNSNGEKQALLADPTKSLNSATV